MAKAKVKKITRGKLVKKVDKVFSDFIRMSNADKNGIAECYTCGKRDHRKQMQCGHFVSRRYYKYRRDENNCRVQCPGCNIFQSGNYKIFTMKMIDEMGRERVEEVLNDKAVSKVSTMELQDLLEHYSEFCFEMAKKL